MAFSARAAIFGNPDEPAERGGQCQQSEGVDRIRVRKNQGLAGNEPAFLDPPAADINGMPQFWASFNLAPKRIQDGGWARQITQDDFEISTDDHGRRYAARAGRRSRAALASAGPNGQ